MTILHNRSIILKQFKIKKINIFIFKVIKKEVSTMIKVRIIRKNKFCYDIRPITFKAILKNKKERIVGSIKFNFIMENVEVDFKRRLSYYEKLAVLKSIFYSFW